MAAAWSGACHAKSASPDVPPSAGGVAAAIGRASGGDTISLGTGSHGDVALRGRVFRPPVKVVGRSAANLASISMRDCEGLVFENIDVEASETKNSGPLVRLVECRNVELRGLKIAGRSDGGATGEVDGVVVSKSSKIYLNDNQIVRVRNAAGFRGCEFIGVIGNRINNIRTDAIRVAESEKVILSDNYIHDFGLFEGDHRDGIQLYTVKGALPSRDVIVERNRIEQGAGAPVQGVFLRTADARFERIGIRDNFIAGGNHNGIAVLGGADDVRIEGNVLVGERGWVRLGEVAGLVVTGNEVRTNSDKRFLLEAGGRAARNREGRAPKDGGASARAAWIASHPKTPR